MLLTVLLVRFRGGLLSLECVSGAKYCRFSRGTDGVTSGGDIVYLDERVVCGDVGDRGSRVKI